MIVPALTPIQFWYEFASTYSYLAVDRIESVAPQGSVVWKPFLLGPIFKAQGWNDSPFNLYPAKGAYMWRDLERLCGEVGLPYRRPTRFPRNGLLAARVAHLGSSEGWGADFSRAVFRANFAEDREIAEPSVIGEILADLGRDPEATLASALEPSNKDALRRQTEEATHLGIFGAPSFVVGDELFWGNDRLEAAVDWSRRAKEV